MAIVIEGIWLNNDMVEITKVKALPAGRLPKEYLNEPPYVYQIGKTSKILAIFTCDKYPGDWDVLYSGRKISKGYFERLVDVIIQAGDRLRKINQDGGKFKIEI